MKRQMLVFSILTILLTGVFTGCIEITPRDGAPFSIDNVQSWEDGTFTLQNIEYTKKYSSTIGDYRTADIWFKVDYDVYIDTEIQGFSLTASRGEITYCRWGIGCGWECQKDERTYKCGSTSYIPISKADSPGSLTIHLYHDGQGEKQLYNLRVDETIVYLNYVIENAYGSTQYSAPINSANTEDSTKPAPPTPSDSITVEITKKEWGYDESGKVYDVWLKVKNDAPYADDTTIYNVYCVMADGTKHTSITHYADKEVIAGQYIVAHEKEFNAFGSFDVDEEPKYVDFVLYDGTSFPYPVKDTYRISI